MGAEGRPGGGDKQEEAVVSAARGERAQWVDFSAGEGAATSASRGGGGGGRTAAAAAAVGVDPTHDESGGSVGRGVQGVNPPVATADMPIASTGATPLTAGDGNTVSRGGNRGGKERGCKERGGPDNTGCPTPPPCSRLPIWCPCPHESNRSTSPCWRDAGAAGGNGRPSGSCEANMDAGRPHSPRPVPSPSDPCDQPMVDNNARSTEDLSMRQTPPARTPTSAKRQPPPSPRQEPRSTPPPPQSACCAAPPDTRKGNALSVPVAPKRGSKQLNTPGGTPRRRSATRSDVGGAGKEQGSHAPCSCRPGRADTRQLAEASPTPPDVPGSTADRTITVCTAQVTPVGTKSKPHLEVVRHSPTRAGTC